MTPEPLPFPDEEYLRLVLSFAEAIVTHRIFPEPVLQRFVFLSQRLHEEAIRLRNQSRLDRGRVTLLEAGQGVMPQILSADQNLNQPHPPHA